MKLALLGLLLAFVAAPPANVKGKWEGKLTAQREDGSTREDGALMILDQKDATVTGTVGGGENDQHPITSGTVDGNKVTINAKSGSGREYVIEVTVENDEMKGTIKSGERLATLYLKKKEE
jgi:hypothetical protein